MAAEKPATKEERLEEAAEPAAAIRYRGWKAMPYVIGTEKYVYIAVSTCCKLISLQFSSIYRSTESLHGAGNETFEKLGTIGTSSNLLVYLTTVFHVQSVTAAATLNIFDGTTNLAPVFGAFLSDTYLGRYLTLGFASISSLMVIN